MEMCSAIGVNLQRGMNFRLRGTETIILMSLRPGAPYADRVEDEGRVLIYEGHDSSRTVNEPDPKRVDQPARHPGDSPTENGLFAEAARRYKEGEGPAESVRVYEKIRSGIWVYNGMFDLIECWTEQSDGRKVFKFKLRFAGTDGHYRPHNSSAKFGRRSPHTKLGETRSMEARSGKVPEVWDDFRPPFRRHHPLFEGWVVERSSEYPDIVWATQSRQTRQHRMTPCQRVARELLPCLLAKAAGDLCVETRL